MASSGAGFREPSRVCLLNLVVVQHHAAWLEYCTFAVVTKIAQQELGKQSVTGLGVEWLMVQTTNCLDGC